MKPTITGSQWVTHFPGLQFFGKLSEYTNKDGPGPVWQSFGPADGAVTCPIGLALRSHFTLTCCYASLHT